MIPFLHSISTDQPQAPCGDGVFNEFLQGFCGSATTYASSRLLLDTNNRTASLGASFYLISARLRPVVQGQAGDLRVSCFYLGSILTLFRPRCISKCFNLLIRPPIPLGPTAWAEASVKVVAMLTASSR